MTHPDAPEPPRQYIVSADQLLAVYLTAFFDGCFTLSSHQEEGSAPDDISEYTTGLRDDILADPLCVEQLRRRIINIIRGESGDERIAVYSRGRG